VKGGRFNDPETTPLPKSRKRRRARPGRLLFAGPVDLSRAWSHAGAAAGGPAGGLFSPAARMSASRA